MITNRFSKHAPVSMAQGRHGELIVVQGGGARPARWTGVGAAVDAGMDAPKDAPAITKDSTPKYYVARVDITKPGACYYAPPEATYSTDAPPAPPAGRAAKSAAYLSQSSVTEIRVLDGGKGYGEPPTVVLSDSHGKGAVITAVLAGGADTTTPEPCNNQKTGITSWSIMSSGVVDAADSNPPRFAAVQSVDLPINGNGTFRVTLPYYVRNAPTTGYACGFTGPSAIRGFTNELVYVVSGMSSGSCAVLRTRWFGGIQTGNCCGSLGNCTAFFDGATTLASAVPHKRGEGFSDKDTVRVTIKPVLGDSSQDVVVEGTTAGNDNNDTGPRYPVSALVLENGGSGYLVAPQLKITSNSGFGAYGTCRVANGKIVEVTLENSGGGYKAPPEVEIVSGGAEAFAISRPHLRGTYQCYYRFVDDTPEDRGGPIPSNLSPVTEIDVGEAGSSITWSPPAPTGRAKKVELWRSTGNEATTLYRVAAVTGTHFDDLTDEELRDPDREGYAAMPIVLPNGELNANRFGVPPSDKAVVVRFQDRLWYGVDTSGKQPNTIYYSEVDEPESVPDINEIILQQNARDSDSITALVPFGSTLLLMQERHSFSLTFARNPLLDAQVTPIAYRGCINQRCWDVYDGVCYVADQYGVYMLQPTGQIESLSDAVADLFRDKIDFAKSTWNLLLVDPKTKVLRFFAAFKEDSSSGFPSRVLCCSLETKAWWFEKYPQRISGGTQVRLSNGDFRCAYAADSGPVLLGEGDHDIGRGAVTKVTLTNGGAGYRRPPKVTAPGGCGAEFQASINGSGQVTAIWVVSPGYGYTSGPLVIAPPDDPNSPSPTRAAATYEATSKTADTSLFTSYRYKSGAAEYITDADNPKAGGTMSRNIGVTYRPQPRKCLLSLRTYYNNSPFPRGNVAARNRGTGFTHSTVDNAARHDMVAQQTPSGLESGMAHAMFAGRSLDDIRSSDRHIAIELVGASTSTEPVTIYQLTADGTAGK